jgi:CubicO group peptidase (beta-lactamase class C family)
MSRRIPTAAELGLMHGSPPPADRLVTLNNWQDPPFNRWGFQHVRDLIPTAKIGRGDGPVWKLPRAERDLMGARVRTGSRSTSFRGLVEGTYTDGLLVLHRGRVISETYFNDMRPDTTHLCMSVSKSITSTAIGVLIASGALEPGDLVTTHISELRGTSFDGCTVRHLLDMRAGTRFNEDYDDLNADVRLYEQIYLWRPRVSEGLPASMTGYYPTLENKAPHGGPFDYRSVLTDVLGWVLERAAGARFADVVSDLLWRPMGAEFDAEITVDAHAHPMADGGVCCTLRDLARFGELMRRGGRRGATQVVPHAWVRDILSPDDDQVQAFLASEDAREFPPNAYYRNKWWVVDPSKPIYKGSGINGQTILIHVPAQVVIAKFSTWPVAWDASFSIPESRGLIDLAEQIADGQI